MSDDDQQPAVPDGSGEPPSRHELDGRMLKLEQNVEYVKESVDRIEDNISENQEEMSEKVDQIENKVDKLWHGYILLRYLVPILVGGGGIASYLTFF